MELVSVSASFRKWGARAAFGASTACLGAAVFYYTQFLAAPSSYHIYGAYGGLRDSGNLFLEYSAAWLFAGFWLRILSKRVALISGMVASLVVLNLAFLWTSGLLGPALTLYPSRLPSGWLVAYLGLVQFPTVRSSLDVYYMGWLGMLLLFSVAFFQGGLGKRLVRSFEFAAAATIVLPIEILLFDRREFGVHVMDVQVGTPLAWLTNADLLLALGIGILILGATDHFVLNGERSHGREDKRHLRTDLSSSTR